MKPHRPVYLVCLATLPLIAILRPFVPQAVPDKSPAAILSLPPRIGDAALAKVSVCLNPDCADFRRFFIESEQRAALGCAACGQAVNQNALALPAEKGLAGTTIMSGVYVLEDAAQTSRCYVALFERHDMNYASLRPLLFLSDAGYTKRMREHPAAWATTKTPRLNPPITLKRESNLVIAWAEWEAVTAVYWYGDCGDPQRSLMRYTLANLGERLFRGSVRPLRYGVAWTPTGEDNPLHAERFARQIQALLATPTNQYDSEMR